MQALIRPEAPGEVREACRWYDERIPGRGTEFARAIDAPISAAVRDPARYPVVEGPLRRVPLRRFPCTIVHGIDAGGVVVVACFHHRRDPRVLASRRLK